MCRIAYFHMLNIRGSSVSCDKLNLKNGLFFMNDDGSYSVNQHDVNPGCHNTS